MSDFAERNFNTGFQGLVTTTAIFAAVGGAAIIGYETLRQLRRLPRVQFVKFWKEKRRDREGDGGVDGGVDEEASGHGSGKGVGIGVRGKLTCEDWEMGHLYQARMFHATTPSPPLARWPFAWIKQAILFSDQFYAEHTGMDTVVYVRFLRACVYWTLLHTLTTAPILLAIHITFSKGVDPTDMSRASLSYLVTIPGPGCNISNQDCTRLPNEQGRSLLWIHLTLLWYLTVTWVFALWWIAKGSLRIRRGLIEKTRQKVEEAKRKAAKDRQLAEAQQSALSDTPIGALSSAQGMPADTSAGWRHRTLMVMNLPPTMRDEASIRRYFEEFLRPDDASIISDTDDHGSIRRRSREESDEGRDPAVKGGEESADYHHAAGGTVNSRKGLLEPTHDSAQTAFRTPSEDRAPTGPEPDFDPDRHLKSPVQTVVLVRKMNELSSMLGRRQEVLNQLEAAHIKLAQNVMATVGKRTIKNRRRAKRKLAEDNRATAIAEGRQTKADKVSSGFSSLFGKLTGKNRRRKAAADSDESAPPSGSATPMDQLEVDLEKMAPVKLTADAKAKVDDLARRLARFSPANVGMHSREVQCLGGSEEGEENEMHETVWEALAEVPRDLLDPYQPVTRLSALFRGQSVPTIDYLLTKLNLLTALVTEMRSRPPTSYEATSTAFVTFRDPRQARMVWRELKSQIVVKVRLAPEVKDLDWERLMRTSFTGDLVRGFSVNVGFWAFTIFWVIIINIITNTLFSVQSFKKVLPGVRSFFDANPGFEAFLSITLPTVIVSLITMSIPELIFQISKRAQGFVTFSALYDMCMVRYWKFVICNVIIFFCIGVTTVKTILSQIDETGKILDSIAFSFPTAAPFFVSYMILQLALQSGFEHVGFMIALLQHWGARKAYTPRTRALKTLPRNFNRYYWLPLHINIMAIQFIFAVLNPLIIPFALVYLSVAIVVFKKNFAYHYYRRFNEMEGVVYFTRLLRFSLDALLIMQVVLLIFFSVTDQGSVYIGMTAVLIPLTVILKVLATRLWKSQCRAVEDEEAEAMCGIDSRPTRTKTNDDRDYGTAAHDDAADSRSPLDARASGRYPVAVPPPQTGSAFYRAWQRVHDSFNANGMDKTSYFASAHAKGQKPDNPVELSAKTLVKTPEILVKKTAATRKQYATAAMAHLGLGSRHGDSRTSIGQDSARDDAASQRVHSAMMSSHGNDPLEAEQLKDDLRVARSVSKRRKGDYGRSRAAAIGLARGTSTRSEERPFLSGYDAVSAHAPVQSEDAGDLSFADGDEPYLQLHEEMYRGRSMKRTGSKKGGYSHGTLRKRKGVLTVDDADFGHEPINEVSEFGGSSETEKRAHDLVHEADFADGEPVSNIVRGSKRSNRAAADASEQTQIAGGHGDGDDDDDESDDDADSSLRVLVRPHAPVCWDDTPNNTARYNNPFYNRELDPFLWLPRDPLAPIDLCDTIEWHGPAFVSSQGGPGNVGEWDDEDDDEDYDSESGDGIRFGGEAGDEKYSALDRLDGKEEIIMSDSLARHLEQVEDVEDAPDPAASLPRNLMQDYKRAIRRSSRSSAGGDGNHASSQQDAEELFRSGSRRSRLSAAGEETFKSPTLSARILADERFAGLEPLDLTAEGLAPIESPGEVMAAPPISPGGYQVGMLGTPQIPQRRGSTPSAGGSPARVASMNLEARRAKEAESRKASAATAPTDRPTTAETNASNGRRRMMVSNSGVSFAPPDEAEQGLTLKRRQHEHSPTHTRRGGSQGVSYATAPSVASTNTSRLVTLRAALKAEALEEERRHTLKEKLTRRQKKEKERKKTDAELEEVLTGSEDEGTVRNRAGALDRGNSIMGRYEARKKRDASEAGGEGGHQRDISSASWGGKETGVNRFRLAALGALSISRANTTATSGKAGETGDRVKQAREEWNKNMMPMQEMGASKPMRPSESMPAVSAEGQAADDVTPVASRFVQPSSRPSTAPETGSGGMTPAPAIITTPGTPDTSFTQQQQ